jgi:hypothetical protein
MRIDCFVTAAGLAALVLSPGAAGAQQARPNAGGPPAAAARPSPPAPYRQVSVSLPKPYGDPSLDALRRDIGDIAKRKDRAALTGKVVPKGFFWQREDSDGADPKKSGIDNLAEAIGLDSPDGSGWLALAAYAVDPSAAALPDLKNVVCSPAFPSFNENEMEQVGQATRTDPSDWSYPTAPGVAVHAKPDAGAPVVDKLGMYLVRILPDENPPTANANWIKVVSASGKVGYVSGEALAPLGSDQICYTKEGGGWRIAGYIGGGGGQE